MRRRHGPAAEGVYAALLAAERELVADPPWYPSPTAEEPLLWPSGRLEALEAGEPVRVHGYELPDELVPVYGPNTDLVVHSDDRIERE